MNERILEQQLSVAAEDMDDFPYAADEIVEGLSDDDSNFCLVGVILRFMERNPTLDFGAPGALVHFTERFSRRGYEQELIESLVRYPVIPTVGMLNRLINGTSNPETRSHLIEQMKESASHPTADIETKRLAEHYLKNY